MLGPGDVLARASQRGQLSTQSLMQGSTTGVLWCSRCVESTIEPPCPETSTAAAVPPHHSRCLRMVWLTVAQPDGLPTFHSLVDWRRLASEVLLSSAIARCCSACKDQHSEGWRHTSAVNSASSAAFSCSRAAAAAASASSSTPRMAACISSADKPSLPAPAASAPGIGITDVNWSQPRSCGEALPAYAQTPSLKQALLACACSRCSMKQSMHCTGLNHAAVQKPLPASMQQGQPACSL